ncbi:Two-component response regulator ARR12 [Hordeum vulgare]|nr:Two-component response regulator ARR12 [Hordeum vulgare]
MLSFKSTFFYSGCNEEAIVEGGKGGIYYLMVHFWVGGGSENMGMMEENQRERMEDATVDQFPEGLRVLAVDDDCVCLKVLEALLRRCIYHPTMAMDAKTALKMLRTMKVKFDLVITDVRMPDMDGFKIRELIGLEMDMPVISTVTTQPEVLILFLHVKLFLRSTFTLES